MRNWAERKWTGILKNCTHRTAYIEASAHSCHMIVKTRAEFPFNVSTKWLVQNYSFQKSGWVLSPATPPDFWMHIFQVKIFCENFKLTTNYGEDIMVL